MNKHEAKRARQIIEISSGGSSSCISPVLILMVIAVLYLINN